jgi:DNA-binding CsgD family transcriptional regulator
MDFVDTYPEIAAAVDNVATLDDLESAVRQLIDAYDLKNAVYYLPGAPSLHDVKPVAIITYPHEWVHRYFEADYLPIDPVVSKGFASLLPVDWATFDKRPPRVKQLFGESCDFRIGHQGITFPIRGPKGEAALFTVTSDLPDAEWKDAKRTYLRDLQVLAHTIHAKAVGFGGREKQDNQRRLTPRERECLTWCAVGRTSEDIATILGISEGVVRIHLQSAQRKLDCLNRTHTVAKAMAYKLIFPDITCSDPARFR